MEISGYPIIFHRGGVQGILILSYVFFFHTKKSKKPWVIFGASKTSQILEVKPTELTGALQWAADGAWVMRRLGLKSCRCWLVGWLVTNKHRFLVF